MVGICGGIYPLIICCNLLQKSPWLAGKSVIFYSNVQNPGRLTSILTNILGIILKLIIKYFENGDQLNWSNTIQKHKETHNFTSFCPIKVFVRHGQITKTMNPKNWETKLEWVDADEDNLRFFGHWYSKSCRWDVQNAANATRLGGTSPRWKGSFQLMPWEVLMSEKCEYNIGYFSYWKPWASNPIARQSHMNSAIPHVGLNVWFGRTVLSLMKSELWIVGVWGTCQNRDEEGRWMIPQAKSCRVRKTWKSRY